MGTRAISSAELRAECTTLELAVCSARFATKESLAPHRPGGAENPGTDARAWLAYYRHLHRLHARRGAGGGATTPEQAEAVVLDALRAAPLRVEFSRTHADGTPEVVFVHPKSAHCLLELNARDRLMGWLAARVDHLHASDDPAHLPLLLRAHDEQLYQLQVFCSVVCHEGPGSPFPDGAERPEPAAWTRDLEPVDLLRIVQAHLAVNSARLAALSALVSAQAEPGSTTGRHSWAVFFAAMADEQHTSVESLMRDRSVAAVLASAYTAGAHKREVAEEAKRRAEQQP